MKLLNINRIRECCSEDLNRLKSTTKNFFKFAFPSENNFISCRMVIEYK